MAKAPTPKPTSDVGYQNDLTAKILANPTVEVIEDRRGPRVYELTQEASLNGIDPNYRNKNGV